MGIAAGRLRYPIIIDRLVDGDQNPDTGAVARVWEPMYGHLPGKPLMAGIEYLSAREFIAASAGQSQISARITIRYLPGLDATHRIRHGNKIYNPAGWLPDRDSGLDYLTAPVSEGVNQG